MYKCCGKLGVFALLGVLFFGDSTRGQDLIGVMAEAVKPEVADKLQLTEEQRTKIGDLIKRRQSEMIGLAQKLRESPPDQKERMRNEFRQETERLGYAILDVQQRGQMEHIRVDRLGLLSMADPAISKVLNLADWQRAKVTELVSKANAAARSRDADRVRADVERALRSEISESQWATWQVLAGRSSGADVGTPQPPERPAANTTSAVTKQPANATGEETASQSADASATSPDRLSIADVRLQMNFQAMPWPDVLKWLCEQADMSLQADAMPPGSFTYRDNSRKYSVGEALDIMSASLLGNGYSLLRRDRLLMVVDLEAPMVKNMIRELAEFVPLEQLDARGDFELVKCLFFLARMNPDDAKKEIEQLLSLQGSVISLPSAGQLQVIDTAGVVRAVRALIERAEDPDSLRGSSIVAIPLKHITANEVLDVARPLLNLPEGANSNPDISVSTDTFGNTLFVNAKKPEDTQKLRDLILHLDVAPSASEQVGGTRELPVVQIHELQGSDPDLSFRVLSQRLASEPDVRMELDKETNKLVVQARPSTHKEIEEILLMLSGQSSKFEVIELKHLDTQLAIATIKKFFGLSETGSTDAGAPIIDGDLIMRRLYVKASPKQLEQIRTLIEKLEGSAANNDLGGNVRVIPLPPRKVERALEQVERLWIATKKRNRLRVVEPGSNSAESSLPQRAIVPEESSRSSINGRDSGPAPDDSTPTSQPRDAAAAQQPSAQQPAKNPSRAGEQSSPQKAKAAPAASPEAKTTSRPRTGYFVTTQSPAEPPAVQESASDAAPLPPDGQENMGDDIVIMPGPGGLIITSGDIAALTEFDNIFRMLMEQSSLGSSEPTFFYLKYRKATAAKELLEAILSGTAASSGSGGGGGGLIGDMVSEVGGGLIGSLLGGGGGISASGASLTTGDVIINADPQLNIIIIRANASDLELCEQLLKIIDQPDSPISVQTRGQIAVIEVFSQDAEAVATMVKGLFGDRIEGGGGSGGGGAARQPDPREFLAALTGGGRRGAGGANSQLTETKIAITVDKKTNSLLVMAQPQDIRLIRDLVEELDVAGGDVEEGIVVVPLSGTNLNVDMIDSALKSVLGPRARTNTNSSTNTPAGSSQPSQQNNSGDAEQVRRTAEAFQQLRERFQSGGGGGGGGAPPGRSGFGGGGNSPGGFFNRGGSGGGGPGGSAPQGGRGGR